MSSPPVDPWSGQPEHDPTYGGTPPWPHDWSTSGGQPSYDDGWPTGPPSGGPPTPPPAGPYPTLPYGGPAAPHPTSPYGLPPTPAPTSPYGAAPAPASGGPYGAAPASGGPYGAPASGGPYGGFPPQHGGFATGAPPPGRRPGNMALTLSLVAVLSLVLGGGGLAYFAVEREDDGRGNRAAPTAGPSPEVTTEASPTGSATPSPTASAAPQTRVVAPDTLAGRPKSTDPKLQKLADDMVEEMKSQLSDGTGVIGAFYGGLAERNLVMVVAASAFVLNPTAEVDDAIKGVNEDLSVTGMTLIAPGPLGGVAKCGDGKSNGVPLGVCAWADNGSVGIVVVFFSSAAAAAAEFGTVRGAVEQRD